MPTAATSVAAELLSFKPNSICSENYSESDPSGLSAENTKLSQTAETRKHGRREQRKQHIVSFAEKAAIRWQAHGLHNCTEEYRHVSQLWHRLQELRSCGFRTSTEPTEVRLVPACEHHRIEGVPGIGTEGEVCVENPSEPC